MAVATDSHVRQMDQGHVPTLPIDGVAPGARHFQACPPAVLRGQVNRLVRDVVAIQHQNGNPRQRLERFGRNHRRCDRIECTGNRRRRVVFGKYETAARLEGDDGTHIRAFYRRHPARATRLRMGKQDGRPGLLQHGSYSVGDQPEVERPRVRRDRTEKLVKRRLPCRKLTATEVRRPEANSELVEPHLIVCHGLQRGLDHASAGFASPWLIDQVGSEATTQEQILEALAPIGRRFPTFGRLARTVPHHNRQRTRIHRLLVEGIDVITVVALAFRIGRLQRIERARFRLFHATREETPLRLDLQWLVGHGGRGTEGNRHPDQRGGKARHQSAKAGACLHGSLRDRLSGKSTVGAMLEEARTRISLMHGGYICHIYGMTVASRCTSWSDIFNKATS
ncbi:hypothetical protein D3C71_1182410 [compost metagenome]